MPNSNEIFKFKRNTLYQANKIKIPPDIIKSAKDYWHKIEKAIEKYGPKSTQLHSTRVKNSPLFWKEIRAYYQGLIFFNWYFKGTANFNELEKYVEKARKALEDISKKSNTFFNDFNTKHILYKKSVINSFGLQDSNFNDFVNNKEKVNILKDPRDPNKIELFADFCARILNEKFKIYEQAHNELKEKKSEIVSDDSQDYKILSVKLSDFRDHFKKTIFGDLFPKIDNIIKEAQTKKSIIQLKTYNSPKLNELISAKKELMENCENIDRKFSMLSKYKYGTYRESVYKYADAINDIYYQTNARYKDLSQGRLDYGTVKSYLDKIIDDIIKHKYSIKISLEESSKKLTQKKMNKKADEINQALNNIQMNTDKLSEKCKNITNEIKKFKKSYSKKAWALWFLKKGLNKILDEIGETSKILKAITSILKELVKLIPDGY
ncbi:MAG: hypothetical protein IJJ04_01950 [Clostridia bacterium]|nr:hypothetical protein [Clostridia bacterium]